MGPFGRRDLAYTNTVDTQLFFKASVDLGEFVFTSRSAEPWIRAVRSPIAGLGHGEVGQANHVKDG